MEYQDKITYLENENSSLKQQLFEIQEHLKKYTAPLRSKKYYDNHKEEILLKNKEALTPEKKKEYNKRYYLKKKNENENINSITK
jgi:hypothetical protein